MYVCTTTYERAELLRLQGTKVIDAEVYRRVKQCGILRARRRGRAAGFRKQRRQTLMVGASSSVHTDTRSFVTAFS